MNWMKRHLIYINMVKASALMLMTCTMFLGSCTSESGTGTPDVNPVVPNKSTDKPETATSQDEIIFQVTTNENQEADTRATIIEKIDDLKDFYDASKWLRIYAYYNGTNISYIEGMKMRYLEIADQWQFWSDASGDWAHLYWPIPNSRDVTNSVNVDSYGTLDFVGYVPYDLPTSTYDNEYKVTYEYSGTPAVPHFTATLPYTVGTPNTFNDTNQETLQEFLVAYSPNRTKTTSNSGSLAAGVVPIDFQHPFALVNFFLKEAKRSTVIHSISLSELSVSGIFYGTPWTWDTTSATKAKLSFDLNDPTGLTVPDNVNFNALLGGPFVVIPQALSTANNLTVNCKLPDAVAADQQATIATTWQPGYIYNYYLDLGTDPNHILVDVEVEPWVTHNKIPIDVK